jgi:hypothetical protein
MYIHDHIYIKTHNYNNLNYIYHIMKRTFEILKIFALQSKKIIK